MHLFEVTHLFSLIRHVCRARIGVHHPVSLFSHLAFQSLGHPFSGVFCLFFCSPVFCFHFMFLCLLFSVSHGLNFVPTSFLHGKNPTFSSLHPPITTHTHDQITLTQSTPYSASSNNRSISSFSTSPGHHLRQPDFHQHLGKLGSTSSGVSERRHYRIHHPVLQYGRHQGV